MVVDYNEIKYVGSDSGAAAFVRQYDREVNLNHKVVLPGFHDIHNHIMEANNEVMLTCELPKNKRYSINLGTMSVIA